MKKSHLFLFSLALVATLIFSSCGANGSESKLPSIGEKVLYEQNSVKITLKTVNEDLLGYAFDIEVVNNSNKYYDISSENVCMGGVYYPFSGIQSPQSIKAGETKTIQLLMIEKFINDNGIDRLEDIKFKLVFSNGEEKTKSDYLTINVPKKDEEEEEKPLVMDASGTVILDEKGLMIVSLGIKDINEFDEVKKGIKFYCENNTDKDLYLRPDFTKKILVNEKEASFDLAHNLPANSRSYAVIYIDKDSLAGFDFDEIESVKACILIENEELSDDFVVESDLIDFLK